MCGSGRIEKVWTNKPTQTRQRVDRRWVSVGPRTVSKLQAWTQPPIDVWADKPTPDNERVGLRRVHRSGSPVTLGYQHAIGNAPDRG
ncbi:hypothetical protein Vau01_115280 [Virgisporangium aurantiacum]|uniref:Uncharacterized protein n=1 Tax=Virgisporangium aurantiacum TaxID=175570 RepID=A0A8J3ZJC5_9ACTN|nr:hypothetical protein Vau01_115280 [Virgisporangium aurantiacum]